MQMQFLDEIGNSMEFREFDDNADGAIISNKKLTYEVFDGAYIVPKSKGNKNKGGVYRADGSPVAKSALARGKFLYQSPGKRRFNNSVEIRDENVVFAGHYFDHFGHFLLESLARIWAISSEEDISKIIYIPGEGVAGKFLPLLREIFLDASIEVEILTSPVRYRKVVVPEPGIIIKKSINSNYQKYLRKISEKFFDPKSLEKYKEPLYLSRAGLGQKQRLAYGERELEAALQEAHIRTVRPEKLKFSDQLKLIHQHDLILGFEGSQMHNVLFSDGGKKILYFDYRPVNSNYVMIDKLMGNDSVYLSTEPPVEYRKFVPGGLTSEPFIFDPGKLSLDIQKITGVRISPPVITKASRVEFAAHWSSWMCNKLISWRMKGIKNGPMNADLFSKNMQVLTSAI